MKILIFGNISAGKSSLAKLLLERLQNFEFISIDEIRKRYGDGSIKGEFRCKARLVLKIKEKTDQILEISGTGVLGRRVGRRLARMEKVLLVYPRVSLAEAEIRNSKRTWSVPFPTSIGTITQASKHTEDCLRQGLVLDLLEICPEAELFSFQSAERSDLVKAADLIQALTYINRRDEV